MRRFSSLSAFSLPELLITLAITGLVAAVTIPTFVQSGSPTGGSAKQTAMARDVAFMITNAYEQYKAANPTIPTTLKASDLTPYMNYVAVMSSGTQLDSVANVGGGFISTCTAGTASPQDGVCLKLQSGGALWANTGTQLGGRSNLNVLYFRFDPNATYEGAVADAPGMGMQIALYYNGTIRSRGRIKSNTAYYLINGNSYTKDGPNSAYDPSWFTGF